MSNSERARRDTFSWIGAAVPLNTTANAYVYWKWLFSFWSMLNAWIIVWLGLSLDLHLCPSWLLNGPKKKKRWKKTECAKQRGHHKTAEAGGGGGGGGQRGRLFMRLSQLQMGQLEDDEKLRVQGPRLSRLCLELGSSIGEAGQHLHSNLK